MNSNKAKQLISNCSDEDIMSLLSVLDYSTFATESRLSTVFEGHPPKDAHSDLYRYIRCRVIGQQNYEKVRSIFESNKKKTEKKDAKPYAEKAFNHLLEADRILGEITTNSSVALGLALVYDICKKEKKEALFYDVFQFQHSDEDFVKELEKYAFEEIMSENIYQKMDGVIDKT